MLSWIKRYVFRLDRLADGFSYWIGYPLLAGLWAAMTWLASQTAFIASQGWGANAISGIVLACLIAFAARALFPILTHFLPSRVVPQANPLRGTSDQDRTDQDRTVNADLALLLHSAVDLTTYYYLENFIQTAPNYTGLTNETDNQNRQKRIQSIEDYINRVRGRFAGTDRGFTISSALETARHEAEMQVKVIPMAQLPPHLDQIDFLKCTRLQIECNRLVAILTAEREEKRQHILNLRDRLIERMSARES